jgi:nucleoside-diphosphate-sugar epimerase
LKVLVIGGTGFIGSHVVRHLIAQGHEPAVLHRGTTKIEHSVNVEHIYGNRENLDQSKPAIAGFRPDVVIDVIPYTEQQAKVLVGICRGVAGRIVAVSSADVYRNYDGFRRKSTAPPDPVPLSENAPLRDILYPYRGCDTPFEWADDYDKILIERIVLDASELQAVVLRLPAVYGPGDKQHRVGTYLRRIKEGHPLLMTKGQSKWRWTRGYVENIGVAIALAGVEDCADGRIYNIGEEAALTEKEWVEEIGRAAGWSGDVLHVSEEDLPVHVRQPFDYRYELVTDTARFRKELPYGEPISREEAIRRTVEWERAQNAV